MPEKEVLKVAEKAKMIVNGYAFSGPEDGLISILNLNHPDCAMVVKQDGEVMPIIRATRQRNKSSSLYCQMSKNQTEC